MILVVCNHDDADLLSPWAGASHPRRGDIASVHPDDHQLGRAERTGSRLVIIRAPVSEAQIAPMIETETGFNSDVTRAPWRRRRFKLLDIYALPGVRALHDGDGGLYVDVPADQVEAMLACSFEPPHVTNEQVIL